MSTKQSKEYVEKSGARKKYRQAKQQDLNGKKRPEHKIPKSKQRRKQDGLKRKRERLAGKKARRRIFPIWLRLIVILILCVVALIVGLIVGYGILGDGVPSDALKWETWQHIVDIVKKKE